MTVGKFVSYLRVSTHMQGADGNGIAAQRKAVEDHVSGRELLAEYVEVESGRSSRRPELERAIRHAKATNSVLLVAKLDRIGRRASHVLGLLDNAGVRVVFADSPSAGKLELGVRAVVAEEEARAISERTKAGLAAAKARGVKLGNPNGAAALRRHMVDHGNSAATEGATRAADAFAEHMRWAIEALIEEGVTSNKAMAREMTERGFATRRGTDRWQATSVRRLRDRLAI